MAPKSQSAVQLDTIVICDDVRREDNGKLFIIGMYPTNIGVPTAPHAMAFTVMTTFKAIKNGKATIRLEIRNSWSDQKFGAKTEVDVKSIDDESYLAVLPNVAITVEKPGDISIYMKFDDGDWEFVKRYPVKVGTVTSLPAGAPAERLPPS